MTWAKWDQRKDTLAVWSDLNEFLVTTNGAVVAVSFGGSATVRADFAPSFSVQLAPPFTLVPPTPAYLVFSDDTTMVYADDTAMEYA